MMANEPHYLTAEDVSFAGYIFEQCIDVAFIIYRLSDANFSAKKFEDLVFQILPTAVIYSNAYWPFYKNSKNQCICLCRNFGILCRHRFKEGSVHCLDMTIEEDYSFLGHKGKIKPVKYVTQLMPTPLALPPGYLISTKIYANPEPNPEIHPKLIPKSNRTMPYYVFNINSILKYIGTLEVFPPRYRFMPSAGLKENADLVLDLRKSDTSFLIRPRQYRAEGHCVHWTVCPNAVSAMLFVTEVLCNKYHNAKDTPGPPVEVHASFYNTKNFKKELLCKVLKSLQDFFTKRTLTSNDSVSE